MMESGTSLASSGLRDWILQRATAIVLGLYVIFLLAFFVLHPQLQFTQWQALFANPWMRIFSFLALLSVVAHSWVGIWTVLTDYVEPIYIRLILEVLIVAALLGYLAWGIIIFFAKA